MVLLLVLLTSMNFFVYGDNDNDRSTLVATEKSAGTEDAAGEPDNSPAGPDEKAPGASVSFSEEYLHDESEISSLFIDNLIHQLLIECSKVHPAHSELITPPPDHC